MLMLKTPERLNDFPTTLIENIVSLSTSGLGLVVALAWNEVVQKTITTYVDPYLGKGSNIISLLVYALIITTFAVLITMQLTAVQQKIERFNQRKKNRELKQ
jgi:hypothetical protein